MRVVAGRFGGHGLVAPRGQFTRPTSDRVREALFSILGDSVEGAEVLDLFAGSGALAIGALSGGAAGAVLVDSSAAAVAAIRRNLAAVGADAEVRRQDAFAYLLGELEHRLPGRARGRQGNVPRPGPRGAVPRH